MGSIDDISHKIGGLESKVDRLHDDVKMFMDRFERHDDRLRDIEGHRKYLMGIAAVIAMIFTIAIEFVKDRIFRV